MTTVSIPLTQGKFAVIDEADYPLVAPFKWHAKKSGKTFYAASWQRVGGVSKLVRMHRAITGANPGTEVDHRDGDGLNNRRSNLRECTHAQNGRNRRREEGVFSSRWRGVVWHKQHRRWHASIKFQGRRRHLGYFDNEVEAARAYDEAAQAFFGEFARMNNP